MTIEDLRIAGKDRVRYDATLLTAYKQIFAEKFGREPICAGCTFNNDWNRLMGSENIQTNQNFTTMANKTFTVVKPYNIFTYFKKGKDGVVRAYRTYGHNMTEEFAKAYLSEGTAEELKARKAEFKQLPELLSTDENPLEKLTVPQLKELAKDYPADEWKELKKAELIAYLDAKAIEVDESDVENPVADTDNTTSDATTSAEGTTN